MRRLIGFVLLVGAVFGFFHYLHPLRRFGIAPDEGILILIGVVYFALALVMVRYTRCWTVRSLGLLATMTGDAVLYSTSVWRLLYNQGRLRWTWRTYHSPRFWAIPPVALPHHLRLPAPPMGLTIDLVRSLFLVGGSFLVWGVVTYLLSPSSEDTPL